MVPQPQQIKAVGKDQGSHLNQEAAAPCTFTTHFHQSCLCIGTPGQIRTDTVRGLSSTPLPIGLREHNLVSVEGFEPSLRLKN